MSDKCLKCGAEVRWASRDSVEFACGVTQSTPKHPKINIVQTHGCYERQLAQAREREAELLESAAVEDAYCLAEGHHHANRIEEALCSLRFQRDREKARADKAGAILRAANFCEAHEPIPALSETGCPMCEAVHQADLREKAEADLKTNAGLLAHQTDLAREAEIGEVKAGRLQRLREAAWPVADQVAEMVVVGADGSRCRLVPVGLLLTLREALRARLGEATKSIPNRHVSEEGQAQLDALADAKRKGLASWIEDGAVKTAPKVSGKHFGRHWYDEDGTSDCKHGCGCWMGPCRSGGSVDPFGPCPNNPRPAQGEEADDGEAKG